MLDDNEIQFPLSKTGNLRFTDFSLYSFLITELFIVAKICYILGQVLILRPLRGMKSQF